MTKLNKTVSEAIKNLKAEKSRIQESIATQQAKVDHTSAELSEAKAELPLLMDATVADPSAANEQAEIECRQRIEQLEFALTGTQERLELARNSYGKKLTPLSTEAVASAKKQADDYFDKEIDKKMDNIAKAKTAYLQSLADYKLLQKECQSIKREACEEMEMKPADASEKSYDVKALRHQVNWSHLGGATSDGCKYTVSEHEMNDALKYGTFKQNGQRV
ncbi:hypothetical protein [Geomicrobium sediminis]|uniref:Multidrug resistance efflux pump n=1 Tax=Geomicrobium sediminis TaxID=1347788 RepID=A0ABS2PHY5_9BACL|nr:hypothetical protein [Geomicrobium sediminis]MBM7634946.1 multidrug resistance efflux pump [Geomicrobium sediminis]